MDITDGKLREGRGSSKESGSAGGGCVFTKMFRTLHMAVFVAAVFALTFFYSALILPIALFSRRLARRIGSTWNTCVLGAGGVKVKVTGLEQLDRGERYVFMSNHQSALDIPIIYVGLGDRISFIAKKELFAIPFFGWCMWAVGHISIDRSNARKAHASLAKAVERLKKEKVSLILFPEGTRSKDGKVLDFKTAAFSLALQTGVKLVPVAIKGAIDRLPPKSSRIVPGVVVLEVGTPIGVDELEGRSKADICKRVHGVIKTMVEGRGV